MLVAASLRRWPAAVRPTATRDSCSSARVIRAWRLAGCAHATTGSATARHAFCGCHERDTDRAALAAAATEQRVRVAGQGIGRASLCVGRSRDPPTVLGQAAGRIRICDTRAPALQRHHEQGSAPSCNDRPAARNGAWADVQGRFHGGLSLEFCGNSREPFSGVTGAFRLGVFAPPPGGTAGTRGPASRRRPGVAGLDVARLSHGATVGRTFCTSNRGSTPGMRADEVAGNRPDAVASLQGLRCCAHLQPISGCPCNGIRQGFAISSADRRRAPLRRAAII